MLKILQARLQQYVNRELPDVQAGFQKGRGTRDQIVNICWIMKKARVQQSSTQTRSPEMPWPLTLFHQTSPATSKQKRRQQVQLQALEGVYINLNSGTRPKGGSVMSANYCPSGLVVSENGPRFPSQGSRNRCESWGSGWI